MYIWCALHCVVDPCLSLSIFPFFVTPLNYDFSLPFGIFQHFCHIPTILPKSDNIFHYACIINRTVIYWAIYGINRLLVHDCVSVDSYVTKNDCVPLILP
jgi:hypothetical protein